MVQVQKLTFNPVPPEWEVMSHRGDDHFEEAPTVGAFEVPAWKRKGELFDDTSTIHGGNARMVNVFSC